MGVSTRDVIPTSVTHKTYSTGLAEKITIDKSIDEIRKGEAFVVSSALSSSSKWLWNYFRPMNSSRVYHVSFKFMTYPGCHIRLLEGTGSTNTGSGTALSVVNLNRGSTKTGSMIFYTAMDTGAAGGATGSLIFNTYMPDWAITSWGGSDTRTNELILNPIGTGKQGYWIGLGSGSSIVGFEMYWYEID